MNILAVINLFNEYYSIASEAKYKRIHGKEIPSMLAPVACVAKASDHLNLRILSPKQMLQRLPIAFAQIKAVNTSEKLLNEIRQIIYSLYQAKENMNELVKHLIFTEYYSISRTK